MEEIYRTVVEKHSMTQVKIDEILGSVQILQDSDKKAVSSEKSTTASANKGDWEENRLACTD